MAYAGCSPGWAPDQGLAHEGIKSVPEQVAEERERWASDPTNPERIEQAEREEQAETIADEQDDD